MHLELPHISSDHPVILVEPSRVIAYTPIDTMDGSGKSNCVLCLDTGHELFVGLEVKEARKLVQARLRERSE